MNTKYIAVLLLILTAGCSKYTDIKTQGSLIPKQTINYRYLLNGTSTFEGGGQLPDIATADVNITDSIQQASITGNSYYTFFKNCYNWQSPIYATAVDRDQDWDTYYGRIYNCNTIIAEVPSSTGSTDSVKNELIAEALVHRADAYLNLVNEYAKPYNASTASSDLGVPLLLTPSLDAKLDRATVATVYNRLEADLKSALIALPKVTAFNTLPGKAAAYSLLARLYLFMGNYTSAGSYADSALLLKSGLNDLGTISSYPTKLQNPEIIFGKIAYTSVAYSPTTLRLGDELLNLLGTTDMRYVLFTADAATNLGNGYTGRFFALERSTYQTRNIGTSVPEMMLIKAESLARSGSAGSAIDIVNQLRSKRFKAADYVALTATDANDALVQVINERRREFFCRHLPWYDQRRLKNDPLFSRTYTRTWQGITYTLDPNSNRYVFPIGQYYIGYNPEIVQNP
ncbi:SusD family protein [Chitinophaga sp. YR573]|uniref:RagB/SusD family nutrient uptake outer membrane protein n=1 Tax=Chitinophaga sp. YR573 TaxID=1881040 RepID=UPI0008D845DD|nr:RagB/SusD family nutrient uptake outer membrane protein [Chitinophaga sp. YR573]SEW34468.1 SusD family protein [Chitinophaga sp. YR573]